jgi:16S rRNA (cytidine1402-2'-O)-methyltransferase
LNAGRLYLIPVALGDRAEASQLLPPATLQAARRLRRFFVENPKSARAFLKRIGYPLPLQSAEMIPIGCNAGGADPAALLRPLLGGDDAGLLSEAGCPAVADPGALLVRAAHQSGITVLPLVGPSAILLALMASGLNGQRFAFQGYLPVAAAPRAARIRQIEQRSRQEDSTQLFIETPYRNDALFAALLEHCAPDTLLCVAAGLGEPGETVLTRRVADWRLDGRRPGRRPAVFLLLAAGRLLKK